MTEQTSLLQQAITKWVWRIIGIAYYLVFLVCTLRLVGLMDTLGSLPGQVLFIASVLLIFASWTVIIAVHELGHAIVAWIFGWRVPVIAVRGLTVWPNRRRIHYGLPAFPLLNGAVLTAPGRLGNARYEAVMVYLGGGSANLILAVVAGVFSVQSHSEFWAGYLEIISLLSVMIGILNLVPRMWGRANDGWYIYEFLKGRNVASRLCELQFAEEFERNVRPRDWNATLMREFLVHAKSGGASGNANLTLFAWHLDRREFTEATECLLQAEKLLGSADTNVLISRAFVLAYFDRDASEARTVLNRVKQKKLRATFEYCLVDAVIEAVTGDLAALDSALRRAQVALRRSPFKSMTNLDYLKELQAVLDTGKISLGQTAILQ